MIMRILVTGVAGFIGSSIADRLLAENHDVIGIDCFTDYYSREIKESNLANCLANRRFTFIEKNILGAAPDELLDGVTVIFHQAAQAGVRASWGANFEIYTANNILATQKLLEAIKGSPIKFVYASSSSVYGEVQELPMREDNALRPLSPYGVSKLAAENLCSLYNKNFGIHTVSLRYFTVYGPRQRPDMAFHKFIKAMIPGKPIEIFGDGEQTRDFTFISDAVDANLSAMRRAPSGAIYNIGGGTRISLNGTIRILEQIIGKKAIVSHFERQKGDVSHTYASTERAKNDIGFSPTVSLEEGLRAEVEWIKKIYSY
jgi:nucleoside-diphosphate-sugar epimerase